MALRAQFTDAEWQTLEKTPIWGFLMTAAADSNIDAKEDQAFVKELMEAHLYKDELVREVFSSCAADFAQLYPDCLIAPQQLLSSLESARALLEERVPAHAEPFKAAVLLVCKNVAEASGGSIFHREPHDRISEEEMRSLLLLAATLGIRLSA